MAWDFSTFSYVLHDCTGVQRLRVASASRCNKRHKRDAVQEKVGSHAAINPRDSAERHRERRKRRSGRKGRKRRKKTRRRFFLFAFPRKMMTDFSSFAGPGDKGLRNTELEGENYASAQF